MLMTKHIPWRADAAHRQCAKLLRHDCTVAEEALWALLRNRQMMGLKFRRQHPIRGFIVDFYCAERKVAIEVDGSVHRNLPGYDQEREAILQQRGIRILRLSNELVLDHPHKAVQILSEFVEMDCKIAE